MSDPRALLRSFVDGLRDAPLDWRSKGFGSLPAPSSGAALAAGDVRLSALGTPMMTLDAAALAHNADVMATWCADHGVGLAPHGKTTMAPLLWLAQLDAGARAITVANASQLRAAHAFGVRSVVVANELVGAAELRWLADTRDADAEFHVLSWVDSVAAVQRIETALAGARPERPLTVCVELGSQRGRAGARTQAEVRVVAEQVIASDVCMLAGVSGYEGSVAGAGGDAAGLAAVETFLHDLATAYRALAHRFETEVVTVTAGGSAHFDAVTRVLGPLAGPREGHTVDVVLRSGAYVVHDDVHYAGLTPSTRGDGPPLRPAIHVRAQVLSRPEAGLALLDAGKRDLPFDLDLPVVLDAVRGAGEPVAVGPAEVVALNDQHAYVRLDPASPLAVGDVVRLGLSHPCTAFDKWRAIALVDDATAPDPRVVDAVHTFF